MVSDLKKEIEEIKKSKEFIEYKDKNEESYLSSCFLFYEDSENALWQFNFYNPKEDNMTIFMHEKEIEVKGPEKIAREKESKVEELDIKRVKLSFDKALEKINKLRDKKYKNEIPDKTIVVLQSLNKKVVWNISFLTQQSNLLNFKVNASSGKILEHKLNSVMEFKAK